MTITTKECKHHQLVHGAFQKNHNGSQLVRGLEVMLSGLLHGSHC